MRRSDRVHFLSLHLARISVVAGFLQYDVVFVFPATEYRVKLEGGERKEKCACMYY